MANESSATGSSNLSSGLISVIIGVVFVVMMTLVIYLLEQPGSDSEPVAQLQGFELIKHDGRPFTLADMHGHWSLVFFGYMNCPDVCPATMMQLKQFYDRIPTKGAQAPQVVFISVDGKRDTPARLADYVGYFDESFIGVSGTAGQITTITEQLDAFYRIKNSNDDNYDVVHTADLFVIDPQGRVVERLTPPLDVQALLDEYRALTDNTGALALHNSTTASRYGMQ
jgi:protein SCO1/2